MPPKKKQEQIDLSTLPQCKSINIFLFCKGKEERAKKILTKIDTKYNKMVFHVTRAQVLDYAKQKGIYVDPDTLTDKQKKDAKFMESVCTQLTPQVLAKATDAYLNNQNVKIRIQKKAELAKPQAEQEKKKIDGIYIFDDFPTQTVDFQALAAANQGVKFIFVIDPKISWVSAPEEPQPVEDPDEEGNEQVDEQYEQYKKMKQAQEFTPEDEKRQKAIQQKVESLRNTRRQSSTNSQFRNTVIDYIKCTIDPYSQQTNIEEVSGLLLTRCEQLVQEESQFNEWRKDKQCEKLPEKQQKQEEQTNKIQQITQPKTQNSDNIIQTLKNLLFSFSSAVSKDEKNNEEIDFNGFDFAAPIAELQEQRQITSENQLQSTFLQNNERVVKSQKDFIQEILRSLKYPGIDRYMIPELPPKSEGLRKLYRSTFGQFLPQGLSFEDFERKLNILFLQSAAKQVDQQRNYDFSNKIYEEHHTKQSLLRQLSKALLFDESTVTLKYNENNDKLYLCLLYKNPPRRMNKKVWESNWKVLPNFQSWLKYFKENENNLNSNHYYDIDYELIGNIEEKANVYSTKEGGAIVRKKMIIAGRENQLLYCLPGHNTGDLVFGLRNKGPIAQFYAQNQIVNISVAQVEEKRGFQNPQHNQQSQQKQQRSSKSISIFLSFKNQTIIELKENGNILIRKPNNKPRLITRDGYTIIYGNKKSQILHPNGGISHPPTKYINEHGRGLQNERLYTVPTLQRLTQEGQSIIRRDDRTVIVEEQSRKWIKFPDSTQYLLENGEMKIEKENFPKLKFLEDGSLNIFYNGIEIKSRQGQKGYEYILSFNRISTCNHSQLLFLKNTIEVYDGRTQTPYICSLQTASISKSWENQSITVAFKDSQYQRNEKQIVDPEQDEENYNEDDVIKSDYLEPRLFIINNDNTGIQLLSDSQLKRGYFQNFQKEGNEEGTDNFSRTQIRQVPHFKEPNKSFVYGVVPVPSKEKLNKKTIKPTLINLDVFNNEDENKQYKYGPPPVLQLRSLVKNQPITQQDRQTIEEIVRKRNEWQAKSERQENEFGHKPRNDPSIPDRFESKKKCIQFRKLKEEEILSDYMKNQAIDLYNKETQNKMKTIENQRKEAQMKRRLSKKKSYVSQYTWKQPAPIEKDENQNYYHEDGRFLTNYFETTEGRKALSQMPQWVFRPKQEKRQHQLDPEIRQELNATLNRTKKQQQSMNRTNKVSAPSQSEKNQRFDTVQVQIKPSPQVYIKPSVFTQRQIDEERFAFQTEKKAYEYHERKRKDFDLYGRDRRDKIEVPSLMRTQPISELNQKYLVTEAPVDKKVKISSMKNKLTSSASNMTQMRKQGPHANLMRTINKGNDYSKLLERRTMMVQADLNDRLQRDILINPIQANFGVVREGGNYQLKIQVKNEDILAQRIQLKKPSSIFCKVQMVQMGPIALGMTRKINVYLRASPEIIGKFTDEFSIVTKHQIYHIPIQAQILSKNQFEATGSALSRTVREFEEIGKKKREQLPPIKSP